MELTDKQERFCQEYLIDLNATQAAIRAGYSQKTAQQTGSENLLKPVIQKRLNEIRKPLQEETKITQLRVIEEYAKIAFANVKDVFMVDNQLMDVQQMDDNVAAAISTVKSFEERDRGSGEIVGYNKEIKFHDKIRALDALGKHLGIFEKDNSQKGQGINIGALSNDVLKALIDASK